MATTFAAASGIALSNGDLTATATSYAYKFTKTVAGKNTGKLYYEILIGTLGDSDSCCGLCNADGDPIQIPLSGLDALVCRRYGSINFNGSGTGINLTGVTDTSGKVLRVAVDLDAQRAWFAIDTGLWNNDGSADPETGTNGIDISAICDEDIFPGVGPVASGDSYTGRFVDADFDHAIPTGFAAWDSVAPPSPEFWNSADKTTNLTLTDSDLTANVADDEATVQGVRSITGRTEGKLYFEVNVKGSTAGTTIGVIREDADLDTNGIGIPWSGAYFSIMPGKPGTIALYNGVHDATLRFCVDFDNRKLFYSSVSVELGATSGDRDTYSDLPNVWNWQNLPAKGDVEAALKVFASSIGTSSASKPKYDSVELTANYGDSAFLYDVPDGYTSWDGQQEGDPLEPPPVPKRPPGRVLITSDQVATNTPNNGLLSINGGAFAYVNTGQRGGGGQIARPASAYSKELGRFVIIGGNMFGVDLDKYYGYSNDGVTWSFATGPGYEATCAVWADTLGLFVALCRTGTDRLLTSPDGITWTERSTVDDSKDWRSLGWSPDLGLLVAVAYDSDVFMYSADGINWTSGTLPSSGYWSGIAWSPLLQTFIITNEYSGKVLHSPDGITWTNHDISLVSGRAVCWSDELALFALTSSGAVKLSEDGLVWNEHATATTGTNWRDIVWSKSAGKFYVVNPNGYVDESPDGISWTATTLPGGDQTDFIRLLDAPQRNLDQLDASFTDEAELTAPSPLINPFENLSALFTGDNELTANIKVGDQIDLAATLQDEALLSATISIGAGMPPRVQTIIIALG